MQSIMFLFQNLMSKIPIIWRFCFKDHFICLFEVLFYYFINSIIDNYLLKISVSVEFQNSPNLLNSIFWTVELFFVCWNPVMLNLFKSKIAKSMLFRQPMSMSQYLFIAISQYREQKCLVCIAPNTDQNYKQF